MLSLWKSFDKLFASVFSDFDDLFPGPSLSLGMSHETNEDGSFVTTIDVSGFENNLVTEVKNGVVTVSGKAKTKTSSSSFYKAFTVPLSCDENNLTSECQNGVLTLTAPPKALPAHKE